MTKTGRRLNIFTGHGRIKKERITEPFPKAEVLGKPQRKAILLTARRLTYSEIEKMLLGNRTLNVKRLKDLRKRYYNFSGINQYI
jgi:hypothetical protein